MSDTSPLVPIDATRRDLLRAAGLALTAGTISAEAAQHVHQHAAAEKKASGAYKPKFFRPHEWKTLESLTDTIIPGAKNAGAVEFIDLLCSANEELAAIFTGGLLWIDQHMKKRHGKAYVDCTPAEQTALLDILAYKKNETPELAPGFRFFDWVRMMAADAYYTSPEGIKEVGYMGNKGMSEFKIPQEAYDYALTKSGLDA